MLHFEHLAHDYEVPGPFSLGTADAPIVLNADNFSDFIENIESVLSESQE
jgi:hypothetical protein